MHNSRVPGRPETGNMLCRYTAWSLDQSILYHDANGSDYAQLVGVADSYTYGETSPPSWGAPASYQEICYVGDMTVSPHCL